MADTKAALLTLDTHAPGDKVSSSIVVPDDATEALVEFARCTSKDATIWAGFSTEIQYDQEISLDGGITWIQAGGFTSVGGIRKDLKGADGGLTTMTVPLAEGKGRLLRAVTKIKNGTIKTKADITFLAKKKDVVAAPEHNSPTLDSSSSASATGTYVTSLTTPAWTCSGTNRYITAMMAWADIPLTENYSSIKWGGSGGTSLSQIGSTLTLGNSRLAIAGMVAPATGSNTLYGALSGGPYDFYLAGSTWTGVDQTNPIGTAVQNSGTSTSPNVTVSSETGGTVQDFLEIENTATRTPSGTEIVAMRQTISGEGGINSQYKAGAASVAMSWTTSNAAWMIIGLPLKAAAGGINITGTETLGATEATPAAALSGLAITGIETLGFSESLD